MNIQDVIKWRDSAIADGWEHTPTSKNEPEESWCKLQRDGFEAQVISRRKGQDFGWMKQKEDYAVIALWGSDGLSIDPPAVYSMSEIVRLTRICSECGKECETVRLAFANRVCRECRVKLAPKYEAPGWCD